VREKLTRLARHSTVYTVGNLLNRSLFFLLVPLYTRLLTREDYGSLVLLNAGAMVLAMVYELGVVSSTQRFYFDDSVDHRDLVGTVWLSQLGLTLCFSVLLTVAGPWLLQPLFEGIPYWPLLVMMVWIPFLGTANDVPQSLFRAREQAWRLTGLVLVQTATMLTLTVLLVWILDLGLTGAVGAMLAGNAVFFVVYGRISWREARKVVDRRLARQVLVFGLPLMGAQAAWWVLDAADRFILGHYTSLGIVALYSVGYVVGKALQMVSQSVNLAWTPFFYRTVQDADPEGPELFRRTATYFIVLLVGAGLLIVVFSREAILVAAGSDYLDAQRVTAVIVLASVVQGMYYVPSRSLMLERKTRLLLVIVVAAAAINIALNFALVPVWEMMGAAWATVIGYAVAVALTYVAAQRVYPIDYDVRRLAWAFSWGLLLGGASLFFQQGDAVSILIRILLAAAYPLGLLAMGYFDARERRALRLYAAHGWARLVGH
jgi:O-antigen/teichoic acid export membrane protein